jgi:gliding motility-associated-like protein
MNNLKVIILFLIANISHQINAQTLIMNEVSNGAVGNQEYVEFVVVSNTVTYNCSSPTPPCIDIRNWIFDDNSGYHGGSGVAPGAVRFSNNPIWACVPLGTIILIYNDGDRNVAIPPDDLSMIDGNCTIIAPMNSNLFESNATTPGAVACSYPAVGWTLGGNWNNTVFANPGDCARIVDLGGCEVFSVCWGIDNLNNLIYFPATAAQRVYYFNDVNPQLQANWTNGSASPSPGSQTPGVPNNPLNAAYIAQFNNGCLPITSISVTATSINAGCTCNGSATANASGSIGGYTYLWSNGQTTATTSSLCAGVYTVTATSHIGCPITTTVLITSSSSTSVTVNSQTICAGAASVLTASPSVLGGTYLWLPGGQTTQTISVSPSSTTIYSVSYTLSGCSTFTTATVFVNPSPILTVNSSTICVGQSATLTSVGATTYTWNTGSTLNPLTVSPLATTNYTVTGTTAGCTNTAVTTVSVNPNLTLIVNNPTICIGQTVTLTVTGASTYTWSNGTFGTSLLISPISNSSFTINGISGVCSGSTIATVSVNPLPIVTVNSSTICVGQSATLTSAGATTYTWNTGSTLNTLTVSPLSTTNYSVTGTTAGCPNTAVAIVSVNPLPIVTVNSTNICVGQSSLLTALGATTYSWSTGSTLNLLTVSPIVTTNYTVTGTTGSCTNTAVSNVSVNPLPIVTVSSATICGGQTATLTSLGASTYSWNTGSVSNPLSVSPLLTTNYTVTGTAISGCSASAIGTVIVISNPTLTALSSQPIICSGAISNLSAYGAINYTWSGGGALTSTVSVSPSVTSIYTVTGSNGLAPVICLNTQTVLVTVIPQTTVIVSATHPICVGESENVYAQGGDTYNWLPTTGVSSPTAFTTFIQPTATTIYTVTASHSGLCPGTATIQIVVHPLPYVYAGVDTTINIDESYVLHGTGNVPVGFLSPNSNPLICNYCATVEVNPKETTCYTLKGESEFGCVAYDEVCINVTKDWNVYIPNAFSPNDDSDNDVFIPVGYGLSDIKLYIFDRWGELIFMSNNRIIGWDGTLNDSKCEQGVYVYKAEIKTITGIRIFRTGHVTLLSNIK